MNPSFHNWAEDRKLKGLVLLVLALAAVALAGYTYYAFKSAKYLYSGPTTISVRGVGEVIVVPDVATFSFSVQAEAADPASAQKDAAEKSNAIIAYLKESGITDTDIKTLGYNLYPRYRDVIMPLPRTTSSQDAPGVETEIMPIAYDYSIPEIIGYSVDQRVEVKVRDTAKAGDLITGVGERGATDVSGLEFTIDDDIGARAEAREKAITDAKDKAKQLADALGVRLVRLQNFWEDEASYPMEKGYGGEIMVGDALIAPDLPMGENTVTSVVNLSYVIR